MLPPEEDVADRTPVWNAFQDLFMDTESDDEHAYIARRCADSKYTLEELESILFKEVFPALKFNLLQIAGEWRGFQTDWLVERILKKHSFGKRAPWFLRSYVKDAWSEIEPQIQALRDV